MDKMFRMDTKSGKVLLKNLVPDRGCHNSRATERGSSPTAGVFF